MTAGDIRLSHKNHDLVIVTRPVALTNYPLLSAVFLFSLHHVWSMPHISTVNQRTLPPAINQGFAATTGSMGPQWYKTVADIFADVLSTRPGDRLFFQITSRSVGGSSSLDEYLSYVNFNNQPSFSSTSNGFTGIVEIEGRPFFDPTQVGNEASVPASVPVRVPLNCEGYLPRPVTEEQALTYKTESTELWNPKYKKALQGAKSLTSLTPEEGDQLAALVHRANDREYGVRQETYSGDASGKISIDDRLDQEEGVGTVRTSPPDSIQDLSLDEIPIARGSRFRVEKTLEAWLMEMIDSDHGDLRRVLGPTDELTWFTNYVPYGISGKNMDGLAFHERDGSRYKISTIELKRGEADKSAVRQVLGYAQWVTSYLADGKEQVVQPILIAHEFTDAAIEAAESQLAPRPPMLVSYQLEQGSCTLEIEAGRPSQ